MAKGTFFDVDYTILSNNSASLFIKYMRQRGEVTIREILLSLFYLLQYKFNLLDFETLADREMMKVEGQSEQEMIDLCDQWFKDMVVHYIYSEAVIKINEHLKEGDTVVLLTAATDYIARPLAEHIGVKHFLCNRLEVVDGKFTGKLIKPVCYGEGKLYWAGKFADENDINLDDSYYYSDSITDLHVLEKFGHPVVVNPDALLRKEAGQREWPVIKFGR